MKKWLSRLSKIAFFLIAFLAVVITVLVNMGGSNDTLKGAIEDYIFQATGGYAAQIETFNKMTFFPYISIDIDGVRLKKVDMDQVNIWAAQQAEIQKAAKQDPEVTAAPPLVPFPVGFDMPDAIIQKLVISMGFWDVFFGGRKVHTFKVTGAHFNAGVLSYKEIDLDGMEIDETADGTPFFNMYGHVGDIAFKGNLDLQGSGGFKNRKYKIDEESNFEAEIGTLKMTGVLRPRTMGGFHIRDLNLSHAGEDVMTATFSFVRGGNKVIDIKGDFQTAEASSIGKMNWTINTNNDLDKDEFNVKGTIEAKTIIAEDFAKGSKIARSWQAWNDIFNDPTVPEDTVLKTDITVTSDIYKKAGQEIAPFTGIAILTPPYMTFEKSSQETPAQ